MRLWSELQQEPSRPMVMDYCSTAIVSVRSTRSGGWCERLGRTPWFHGYFAFRRRSFRSRRRSSIQSSLGAIGARIGLRGCGRCCPGMIAGRRAPGLGCEWILRGWPRRSHDTETSLRFIYGVRRVVGSTSLARGRLGDQATASSDSHLSLRADRLAYRSPAF